MSIDVLLVDKDKAFGTILREGLKATGEYQVTVTATGQAALGKVGAHAFNLIIVDMGIEDMPPETLVRSFHDEAPDVPVMVIPFFGAEMPQGLAEGEVQGILPKPFFVEDLPRLMAQVLTGDSEGEDVVTAAPPAPTSAPAAAPTPKRDVAESPAPPRKRTGKARVPEGKFQPILKDLSRELSAEAVLVIVDEEPVAWFGTMEHEWVSQLADQIAETAKLSGRTAAFLGEPSESFDQTLFEGSRFRLLSLRLSATPQVFLCLALSSDTPLGAIRYRARQAAQEILALLA